MAFYTVRPLAGWSGARTTDHAHRPTSTFRASWSSTAGLLIRELDHLGAANVVLQLDVTEKDLRIDGQLRANASPADPGVRMLFDSKHGPLTYQCDSCRNWQHNVRSIALGLQALRAVDRYAISQHGQQYKGYREIASGTGGVNDACLLLARIAWPGEADDLRAEWAPKITTDPDIARNTLRQARARAHPDRHAGDRAAWDQVEAASRKLRLTH